MLNFLTLAFALEANMYTCVSRPYTAKYLLAGLVSLGCGGYDFWSIVWQTAGACYDRFVRDPSPSDRNCRARVDRGRPQSSVPPPARPGSLACGRHGSLHSSAARYAGGVLTSCAWSAGMTSLAKRRICSINISCGVAPRFKETCTILAPACSASAMIRSVTS